MIRVVVERDELLAAIEEVSPGWRAEAKKRTREAKAARRVEEGRGTWSEIKVVFIRLQEHKCIYCEQAMAMTASGSADFVAVDYDVEHFRPKNRVTGWPSATVLERRPNLDYADKLQAGVADGYVRLAFDPTNFVVSCKVCNSQYKADHFPIAGTPQSGLINRKLLDARERPLLLFPFGAWGDDPAEFLTFVGPVIRPKPKRGHARLRARTVIDFFELDTREDLFVQRATILVTLFPQLEARTGAATLLERTRAEKFVDALRRGPAPHAACARAYIDLYDANPRVAKELYDASIEYVVSKDPALFGAMARDGQA